MLLPTAIWLGNIGLSVVGLALIAWPIIWILGITSDGGKTAVFGMLLAVALVAYVVETLDRRFGLLPRLMSTLMKRDVQGLMTRGFGRKAE